MPLRTPAQAVAFALAQARWAHAMCLNFAWNCYAVGNVSSNLTAQGYPPPISRAIDGWNGSPMKHAGDRNPPIGALVYYSAASSGATAGDGHVAIYVGGGMIRSTDAAGYGLNATVPLDWPERNWGRRYLGWTGDVLGHPMFFNTAPAAVTRPAAPIPLEENEMVLIRSTENGSIALVGEHYVGEYGGSDKAGIEAAVAAFGTPKPVTTAQYAVVVARAKGRRDELVAAVAKAVAGK